MARISWLARIFLLQDPDSCCSTYPFFHEVDECGPLHLDWLSLPIIQRQHEVEEVTLTEVVGRHLLEVGTTKSTAGKQRGTLLFGGRTRRI